MNCCRERQSRSSLAKTFLPSEPHSGPLLLQSSTCHPAHQQNSTSRCAARNRVGACAMLLPQALCAPPVSSAKRAARRPDVDEKGTCSEQNLMKQFPYHPTHISPISPIRFIAHLDPLGNVSLVLRDVEGSEHENPPSKKFSAVSRSNCRVCLASFTAGSSPGGELLSWKWRR